MKLIPIALALLVPLTATAEEGRAHYFFATWDLDADGAVTLAEVAQARDDVFNKFDFDENGLLDEEEYFYFNDARKKDMAAQGGDEMGEVEESFQMEFNDIDADGLISVEEFVTRAADWLAIIDRDGSGDVTPADFEPRG